MTMSRLSGPTQCKIIEELAEWDWSILTLESTFPRGMARRIASAVFKSKRLVPNEKIQQIRDFVQKHKGMLLQKIKNHDFTPLTDTGVAIDHLHPYVPKIRVEKDKAEARPILPPLPEEREEISQREEGPGAAGDEDDEDDEDDNDEDERSSTSSIEIVMETEEDRARFEYMKERVLKGPDPLNSWISDPQQRRMAGKRRLSKLSKLSDEEDNNMYKKSRKN